MPMESRQMNLCGRNCKSQSIVTNQKLFSFVLLKIVIRRKLLCWTLFDLLTNHGQNHCKSLSHRSSWLILINNFICLRKNHSQHVNYICYIYVQSSLSINIIYYEKTLSAWKLPAGKKGRCFGNNCFGRMDDLEIDFNIRVSLLLLAFVDFKRYFGYIDVGDVNLVTVFECS